MRLGRPPGAIVGACLFVLLIAHAVFAGKEPRLTIHVVDCASVPYGAITEAQHSVQRVMGTAGVQSMWRTESAPRQLPPQKDHVTVIILSEEMARRKTAAEHLPTEVLGSAAPPPIGRAWIFYDRIVEAAALQGVSVGAALGQIISHEIGHMVANIEHSDRGTMQRAFHGNQPEPGGFTPEQAARLRLMLTVGEQGKESDVAHR